MQLEFPFTQPFIDAVQATEQAQIDSWNNYLEFVRKVLPENFSDTMKGLFSGFNYEPTDDSLAIPMTVLLGKKDQLEFPFCRALDETHWGFPVEYEYERPLNWRDDLIVDKI